jgi:hypothetical protein
MGRHDTRGNIASAIDLVVKSVEGGTVQIWYLESWSASVSVFIVANFKS